MPSTYCLRSLRAICLRQLCSCCCLSEESTLSQQLSCSQATARDAQVVPRRLFITARRVCIRRTMPLQDVYLSVRPSHAGIECKRLYISSNFFTVAQPHVPFQFFHTKRDATFLRERLEQGRRMQGGMKKSRFSTNISLYLANDARQSHITMQGEQETAPKLSNGTGLNDFE